MRQFLRCIALCVVAAAPPARAQTSGAATERVRPVRVAPGLLPGSMPDSVRARLLDSIAAGRARWLAHRPRAYQLAVTVGCFCAPARTAPKRPVVSVRGDRIVGVGTLPRRQLREGHLEILVWEVLTVDSLFAQAERALRNPRVAVSTMELDPRYGFPTLFVSESPGIADSRAAVEVRYFKPRAR